MKVLLINGSPHQKGCTNQALLEIQQELKKQTIDSEIFWIGNQAIDGCIGCGACRKQGECFRQDIVADFHTKAVDYDGFIFGTPVHFAAMSGGLKCFMDRAFYSNKSALTGKPAAGIYSCRRGGDTSTFDELNKYFTISHMPVVSSQYWNMVHGNTPEEVLQDAEGLQTMRSLARNMAWLLKCIQAGKDAGIDFPEHEAPLRTNFIR